MFCNALGRTLLRRSPSPRWFTRVAHFWLVAALAMASVSVNAATADLLRGVGDQERQQLLDAYREQQEGGGSGGGDAEQVRDEARLRGGVTADTEAVQRERVEPARTLDAGHYVLVRVDAENEASPDDPRDPRRFSRADEQQAARQGAASRELAARIADGNPYRIDERGELKLPGQRPIPVRGLSEAQATALLQSQRDLAPLSLRLTYLPLDTQDAGSLTPFGYSVFEGTDSTFAPSVEMPVPADYVLGPGDRLRLNLVGNTERRLSLEIDRQGEVNLPEIGPLAVAGLRFDDAKAQIEEQYGQQTIGVRANVTMGALRTIRVFVLGEAKRPGSHVVSGLSTITNALVVSGGISRVGSLRHIQLKRDGGVVAELDLYDLLLRGDARNDVRLLPGDVIYIPPIGPTVGIGGAVRRPGIYELAGGEAGSGTAATLVRLAGGLLPDADAAMSVVERIDESRRRTVLNVDLRPSSAAEFRMRPGDVVRVATVRPTVADGIRVEGAVYRPGPLGFVRGSRLADVLRSMDELQPNADPHYVLIRREVGNTRRIAVLSADLGAAWDDRESDENVRLAARDRIIVLERVDAQTDLDGTDPRNTTRQRAITALLDELRRQSSDSQPAPIVSIRGRVNAPGDYPLEPGMRISDLVRAGGGLDDAAYTAAAELARFDEASGEQRKVTLVDVSLDDLRSGQPMADAELRPYDSLLVREVPRWSSSDTIELRGEVRFPGEYPIRDGETLDSVIARAGGFTPHAFLDGSVFTRVELRVREQQRLDELAERLRHDLVVQAIQANRAAAGAIGRATDGNAALAVGDELLRQIRASRAVGRLVIDLARVAAPDTNEGVFVRDGDQLIVPRLTQEVTVIGEVQNPSSHLYDPRASRQDYIRASGGLTPNAADDRIYVIRANGAVDDVGSTSWFSRSSDRPLRPGDSIVVPLDSERTPTLPLVAAVTSIIYNIAVAVAAIGSL